MQFIIVQTCYENLQVSQHSCQSTNIAFGPKVSIHCMPFAKQEPIVVKLVHISCVTAET